MHDWKDEILYSYAVSLLNKPYVFGGQNGIVGYDCSGLVVELMQSCGMLPHKVDHTANSLFDYFERGRATYISRPRFGALVFFGKSKKEISHVGFCLDRYRMIEAGGGDSTTLNQNDAIRANAFIRVRPVEVRSDLQAILMPTYNTIGAL